MATTPSPTPSEENRLNRNDASMYNTLDGVMQQKEQNYDEFMKTFSHLRHCDKLNKPSDEDEPMLTFLKRKIAVKKEITEESSRETTADQEIQTLKPTSEETDLEEEVLGEGERCSRMSDVTGHTKSKQVQFDNFVEDSDEEEDTGSGYTSSFFPSTDGSNENSSPSIGRLTSSESDGKSSATSITNEEDQHESKDTKSDGVISPEQKPPSIQPVIVKDDVDNLLDAFMKDILEEENGMPQKDLETVDSTKDSDLNAEEENDVDSVSVNHIGPEPGEGEGEEDGDDKDILFPGEIEEVQSSDSTTNLTMLDFKATFRETAEVTSSDQVCTDAVEAFSLDEDFDYDNVMLTPKYSLEDVDKMGPLLQQRFQSTVET